MGSNTLVSKSDGQTISSSDVNQYKTALDQTLVPRNASSVPTDLSGDLGTSSLRWDNTYSKKYYIGDPANGLSVEENGTNQISIKSSDIERVVIDDDGLDADGLKSATVTQAKMASNSVGTNQILDSNVTTAKLGNLAVTEAKIGSGQVTTTKIGTGAVNTTNIANGAVTADKRSQDVGRSLSSGTFTTTSTSYVNITNCSSTVSATSRPFKFELVPNVGSGASYISLSYFPNVGGLIELYNSTSGTVMGEFELRGTTLTHDEPIILPYVAFVTDDLTGTFLFIARARVTNSSATLTVKNMRLVTTLL